MSQRASRNTRRPPLSQALINERGLRERGREDAPRRLGEIANEILDGLRAKRSEEPR